MNSALIRGSVYIKPMSQSSLYVAFGLFLMVAEEEKRIRENPLARSSYLLKKVFGAFQ